MKKYANIKLYYFSGTGNTYLVAKKVKEEFERKDYNCTLEKMIDVKEVKFNKDDLIGLVFPVAIQSTFPVVWDFVYKLKKAYGQKVFMIDTLEAFSGGVVGPMKKILENKGYKCIGAIEIKMATNMAKKKTSKKYVENITAEALKTASQYVNDLIDGNTNWNRIPVLSDLMRSISSSRGIWTKTSKKISVNHEKCINCKICEKRCPVKAIEIKNNLVNIDYNKCISCVRCVNFCPANAFKLSGKTIIQKKITTNSF